MTTESWQLKGEYFENCNCEVLCPCVVPGPPTDPTEGHCDVGFGSRPIEWCKSTSSC